GIRKVSMASPLAGHRLRTGAVVPAPGPWLARLGRRQLRRADYRGGPPPSTVLWRNRKTLSARPRSAGPRTDPGAEPVAAAWQLPSGDFHRQRSLPRRPPELRPAGNPL